MKKAVSSSETLPPLYKAAWFTVLKYSYCCENIKSHTELTVSCDCLHNSFHGDI